MSYNQSRIVSIKQESLQVNINKMLRKARKMPHKISNFYKVYNIIMIVFSIKFFFSTAEQYYFEFLNNLYDI